MCLAKTFIFCRLLSTYLLWWEKPLDSMQSLSSILDFIPKLPEFSQIGFVYSYTHVFKCFPLEISGFGAIYILRFLIQVELVSDLEPVYSSAGRHPLFLTAFVREEVFSPMCAIGIFVKCQFAMVTWVYFSYGFYFMGFTYGSSFLSI